MPELLSPSEQQERLAALPGWSIVDDGLSRSFRFADFMTAFGFMASAAIAAEKLNHHPEWSNVYNRVEVRLTTHDAGGLTTYDFQLAEIMSTLADGPTPG